MFLLQETLTNRTARLSTLQVMKFLHRHVTAFTLAYVQLSQMMII